MSDSWQRFETSALVLMLFFLAVGLWLPSRGYAGWAVAPIRIDFSAQSRTEAVGVSNDGDQPVQFDVEARLWTQDATGNDLYGDTADLVFFPKVLTVPPGETRIVRVGIKMPATDTERCYRLFIRERQRPAKSDGAHVAILVNFGVPIISAPAKPARSVALTAMALRGGRFSADLRNTGNVLVSFREMILTGLGADGNALFTQNLKGGYLLSGAMRSYTADIPLDTCSQLRKLGLRVAGDEIELAQTVDVDASMCLQP